MKVFAATFADNFEAFVTTATAAAERGEYPEYIRLATEDDGDTSHGLVFLAQKNDTTYGPNGGSLAIVYMEEFDVVRNPADPDRVPFCEAMGLDILAYGVDVVGQVQANQATLEKWNRVRPPLPILDAAGNDIGETAFNIGVIWNRNPPC